MVDVWSAERVLASAAVLGEGPIWDAGEHCLYWVDIERGEVHRFDPETGRDTLVITLDRRVGAVGLRDAGGLVLAVREGFATWQPGRAGIDVIATPLGTRVDCRMNDGACDAAGRFWAGSMALQEGVLRQGSLYRLEPDGSAVEVLAAVSLSNGIGWSPDGRTMYHVDTLARTLSAYPFDEVTGALGRHASADRVQARRWISGWNRSRRRGVHLGRALARVPHLPLLAGRGAARHRRGSDSTRHELCLRRPDARRPLHHDCLTRPGSDSCRGGRPVSRSHRGSGDTVASIPRLSGVELVDGSALLYAVV